MGARLVMSEGRRTFLGRGVVFTLLGATRRLWADDHPRSHKRNRDQGAALRFRPLARPVLVPLSEVSTPWRARPFVADAVTLASASKPNEPVRLAGLLVRTAAGDNRSDRFTAVSVRCPHEYCDVDFLADAGRLPPEVVQEIGRPVTEPVYLCPCHNSTFQGDDGERLAGPAPRGLYRFRVTGVSDTAVEIAEVEEDLLIFI